MIDFEHVTKIYKRSDTPALEDIDFHVDDGEFVFLVGHSGAGKSTLLKLILREELPTEGRGMVDGKEVTMTVKVGDKVITSKYSGTQVKIDGEEVTIVRQNDILAIVE